MISIKKQRKRKLQRLRSRQYRRFLSQRMGSLSVLIKGATRSSRIKRTPKKPANSTQGDLSSMTSKRAGIAAKPKPGSGIRL